MMWGWGDSWGGWIAGALMMLLFWGGIVALVVFLLRGREGQADSVQRQDQPDARKVLEERFAKGEISEEEFEQRRRVLEHAAS